MVERRIKRQFYRQDLFGIQQVDAGGQPDLRELQYTKPGEALIKELRA